MRGTGGRRGVLGIDRLPRSPDRADPSDAALRAEARRRRSADGPRVRRGAGVQRGARHRAASWRRCAPKPTGRRATCWRSTAARTIPRRWPGPRSAATTRFEIVEIDACPNDWAGKVHAVYAGVTRSRGAADADFLLFADADTLFSPGCIALGAGADARTQARSAEPPQHADPRHLVRARRADRRGARADAAFSADAGERRSTAAAARSPTASSCCFAAMPTMRSADTRPSRTRCSRTWRSRGASTTAHARSASSSPTASSIAGCTPTGRSSGAAGSGSTRRPPAGARSGSRRGAPAAGGSARCCRSGRWPRSRWAR